MFDNDGVYALIIIVILFFVYGHLKQPSDKTSRLTRRLPDFKTEKLRYKKNNLLYQIRNFFRVN